MTGRQFAGALAIGKLKKPQLCSGYCQTQQSQHGLTIRRCTRFAVQFISRSGNPALLLDLEPIILRATKPPYNVQIPTER